MGATRRCVRRHGGPGVGPAAVTLGSARGLRLRAAAREAGLLIRDHLNAQTVAADDAVRRVPEHTPEAVHQLFRAQASLVVSDIHGAGGQEFARVYSPELLGMAVASGIQPVLVTPFGVGSALLGTIVAQRRPRAVARRLGGPGTRPRGPAHSGRPASSRARPRS
jgi:hypothetical protein